MKNKEDNQKLYEWAILQIISLEKWDLFNEKLIEWCIDKKQTEINEKIEVCREKWATNPAKRSRAIQSLSNELRDYISETRKNFKDYGNVTRRLVKEFEKADNNPVLVEAGVYINEWFKENFHVE